MSDLHLTRGQLEALARDTTAAESRSRLLSHLARCVHCQRMAASLKLELVASADGGHQNLRIFPSPDEAAYRDAFTRALDKLDAVARQVDRGRAAAPALLLELTNHPPERRSLLVKNSPRFHSWGLAELLLVQAKAALRDEPARAAQLARLGEEVAETLAPNPEGYPFVQDLRARARVFIATAQRLSGDLRGAEENFLAAEELLAEGSGDPLEKAQLMEYEAALYRATRRFEGAACLLAESIRIYQRSGEPHSAGRALISQAKLVGDAGRPLEAIPLLERAAGLIDPDADPRLLLCVHQNLLVYLVDAHAVEQAAALLPQVRRLALRCGSRTDLLRLYWLGGRVAAGLGQKVRAETNLLKAREGFLAEGSHFDVALICLDLALFYLSQARSAEARDLALTSIRYFEAAQVHREALAALLLLKAAVEQESLTFARLEELTVGIRKALIPQPSGAEP